MKRDLHLIKNILLKIEEQYTNFAIFNLKIEGYTLSQIANHCDLLYKEGLLSDYKCQYADNELARFGVGNLTNEGFNYLDLIRDKDNLESYKNFNVYYDNSISIGSENKLDNSNLITGDKNGKK